MQWSKIFAPLSLTDWLDAETKKNAHVKLNEQLVKIGYKENALDDVALDQEYKSLNIQEEMPYFNMTQEYQQWASIKAWKDSLKPSNRHEFTMLAPVVNAEFAPFSNSISNYYKYKD